MTRSKKTTLKLLICVLTMLALATVLVACNIGGGIDYYDYRVTFVYNVGTGENALKGSTATQYLGVLANSLISIQPGYDSTDFPEAAVNGYYLEGWYLPAEVDENGEPKRDENGFVILGRKWNFNTGRVNEDITLYGNFAPMLAVRFINIATGEYIEDKIEYRPNALILKPSISREPKLENHTFLKKYYTDINKTAEFNWSNRRITENIDVYVEFIDGVWTLVDTVDGFRTAISAGDNIYLQDNLNFDGQTLWDSSDYAGVINGNGYTISNINRGTVRIGKTQSDYRLDSFGAIFAGLGEKAHIYNINFVNVNVKYELNSTYQIFDVYLGLLCGKVANGAKLENVSISGSFSYNVIADKYIHVGNDTNYRGVIGENRGTDNINNCNFSEVTVA